jgi:methyl-accepting chemotaxis protein
VDPLRALRQGASFTLGRLMDLSSAAKEQNIASNLIAQNVERIAQMTETNSIATDQASRAASRLEQLGEALKKSVGQFKL